MKTSIDLARDDIDRGRLWKARDRLSGRFVTTPTDQELLRLLGDVYFMMGDLPKAGSVWSLTDLDDDRARESFDALREKHGNDPARILDAIPVRAPFDYPRPAARRLHELAARTSLSDLPPAMAERLRRIAGVQAQAQSRRARVAGWSCCLAFLAAAILTLAALALGFMEIAMTLTGQG